MQLICQAELIHHEAAGLVVEGAVHPPMDDLRRRLPVRRPVHLVLHRGEELLRHLPFALGSNYSGIPNSCRRRQFPLRVDAFHVLVHRRHGDLEQLGNQRLRQPKGLVLKPALNARPAILRLGAAR